ncbi:MAG: ATP-binding protein [Gaiellales bacterium]|nr:MAG: ATP-binding protein [Gaiellales bacterium]
MAIKNEADDAYFSRCPRERVLAQTLDEAFNITFGARHTQYAFWLAAPHDHTKERFGLSHEVLVMYSTHAKNDARILTAIDNIASTPAYKHRIEKLLVLLIHESSGEELPPLLHKQVDWMIVPFSATGLLNPQRGSFYIRGAISRQLSSVDLFGVSSPLKSDKHFFGRENIVQDILARSITGRENTGLFGLRKTGKTSVLYALRRRLSDSKVIAEYFDCQNPGVHSIRWWQVLHNIAVRIIDRLKATRKGVSEVSEFTQQNAGTKFSSLMQSLLNHYDVENIIVILDEIEWITPKVSGRLSTHWDVDFVPFWQAIRATHQETEGGFTFVVSGVNPSCVETPHFDNISNPIFQLAAPRYLPPMSAATVRELVRTVGQYSGLEFEEEVYPYLQSTYGGHPYLIRVACSEVWQGCDTGNPEKKETVSIKHYIRARDTIRVRMTKPIKDILLPLIWWYPEEYDLLHILATGDGVFLDEYLRTKPESMAQIYRYGVLKEGSREFAIQGLSEFLIENGKEYKEEISPFFRGDMPPELLPEIPDIETLGNLFKKRTELEIKLRKAIALYFGVKFNWDDNQVANVIIAGLHKRADRPEPKELFVGRAPNLVLNELFTKDLKDIILHNWDSFGQLFGNSKTRFEMNMDAINVARRVDAHTKPITPEKAQAFENSYNWMLSHLAHVPDLR